VLVDSAYNEYHDKVVLNFHCHLCGKFDLDCFGSWWNNAALPVLENDANFFGILAL